MLVAVVVVGAALRLGWAFVGAEEPVDEGVPRDPGFYMVLGDIIAEGKGYSYEISHDGGLTYDVEPTAYYPPGYPLSLGAMFWAADLVPGEVSQFGAAVAFNVALATATILLVFEVGRRLTNVQVGLLAAALIAVWPNLIVYSGVVLTETLFLFLLMLMFLVALPTSATARSPGVMRLVTTGVLLGLVGIVRPTSFVVAPVFLLLWWRPGRRELGIALRRTAIVGGAALLVVLPWTARNLVRMDAPVLISTNFGDNFCMGHNPEATGAFAAPFGDHPCFEDLYDGEEPRRPEYETERQSETLKRSLRYIRDEPATVVTSIPAKARYTLKEDTDGLTAATDYGHVEVLSARWRDLIKTASNSYYLVVMAAAAAGAVLLIRQRSTGRPQLFFLAAALAQLVPPLLTFGDPRFKLPIYPAVALLAATALAWALNHLRQDTPDLGPDQEEAATPVAATSVPSGP